MNIVDLPNELLFKIAEHIDNPQSFGNFVLICKKTANVGAQVAKKKKNNSPKTCIFPDAVFFILAN